MHRAHRNDDLPEIAAEIIRYALRDAHARPTAPHVRLAAHIDLTRAEIGLHVYGFPSDPDELEVAERVRTLRRVAERLGACGCPELCAGWFRVVISVLGPRTQQDLARFPDTVTTTEPHTPAITYPIYHDLPVTVSTVARPYDPRKDTAR